MNRSVLEKLCRQICGPRGQRAARHWLASGTRDTTRLTMPTVRHKATRTSAANSPALTSEAWDSDVMDREVTDCSVTSEPEGRGSHSQRRVFSSQSQQSANYSVAQDITLPDDYVADSETQEPRPPTSGSSQPSTTVPPYLDFQSARAFSEMPAPFSLPIIGTMWMHMPGGPLHGMTFEQKTKRMQEMYGPIFRETIMLGFTMVHVYRPEDLEAVYRVQGPKPRRDAFRMLHKYNTQFNDGVQGLLTSQGDVWHRLRSQAQVKMMKPKSASAYLHLHNGVSDDFVNTIHRLRDQDGVVSDLLPELYKFAMEGIGCVCFNRRLGALDANIPADSDTFRFIQAVSDVMEATHSELQTLILHRYSAIFKKLVHAQSFIRQLSIKESMRSLEDFARADRDLDGESGDLIPYLMTKTELTERQVLTLISEFFFGGVDTTSHLLGFALYCLAKTPQAQDSLVEEIDRMVGDNDFITANTLGRMSYLKAVTKETVRMMPITPGNGRTLLRDVVLSGYHVPAGISVGMHHDWAGKSEQYVKEPDRFEPRRWLRGSSSLLGDIHPFVLMPFGFGPRSCIGRRFAEQEYSVTLIKILQKYRVEYAHTEDMWYDMRIVNTPMVPFAFRFEARK